MKTTRKNHAVSVRCLCAAFVAMLLLACLMPAGRVGAANTAEIKRMNVMLVIDGSISMEQTDPNGSRYDAIDLFLGMLTDQGNHVGAIVFNKDVNVHRGVEELAGKDAKMKLSKAIRETELKPGTNIGGALLEAVTLLAAAQANNGYESVVVLLSDGATSLDTKKEVNQSLEKKETAIGMAQAPENNIEVYSIYLAGSQGGTMLNSDEIKAGEQELKEIADRTKQSEPAKFEMLANPQTYDEDFARIFKSFYSLIFPNSSITDEKKETFPEDGVLEFELPIPAFGTEEVNVIFKETGEGSKTFTSPSGELAPDALEACIITGGPYAVVKLVEPEDGTWKIKLTGKPNTEVVMNVLYNINSTATLETEGDRNDYDVGETATFRAHLLTNGQVVTDPAVTRDYTATLTLTDLATKAAQTVDMVPQTDGSFTYAFLGADYGSWVGSVVFRCGDLTIVGENTWAVNFGNTAPVASTGSVEYKQTVTPFSGKRFTANISGLFYDAQDGTNLTYTIVSSQLVQGTDDLNAQTGELTIVTANSKSGKLIIEATDSQGAPAQITVQMKVTDLRWLFWTVGGIVLAAIVVVAIVIFVIVNNRPWKGMISITALSSGVERRRGSFRGKKTLAQLGIRNCGVDGVFVPTGNNRLEFRSKTPVHTQYQQNLKKVSLTSGFNTIYADEERTQGIEVQLEPKM